MHRRAPDSPQQMYRQRLAVHSVYSSREEVLSMALICLTAPITKSTILQKTNFLHNFFCLLLFEGTVYVHHFSKIKSQKESQNRRNQGFSYYFCMMIEGSGSGSIPLTSGSGSGRPKNMWIRWIRIRNTVFNPKNCF